MADPAGELLRRTVVGWLAGPTAVGKTEVALALAEKHGWTLLSVDSRQVYRGLDLGTAKPTAAERARVEHLLIDCLDPREACSAGRFRSMALDAIARVANRGGRILAVGGAGLYWEALTRPLHPLPRADAGVRAAHERRIAGSGIEALHADLRAVDPVTAQRLEQGDRQRISRALEVYELTGRPLSDWLQEERAVAVRLPVAALTRERAALWRRLEERGTAMLSAGLLAEIRGLLASGVPVDAPGLRSVGYQEFLPHLLSGAPLEDCRALFLRHSRQYAKRQLTWLRGRVAHAVFVPAGPGQDVAALAEQVEAALRRAPAEAAEAS